MKLIFFILMILQFSGNINAQVVSKMNYSRDSIRIGEQTAFIYEISFPEELNIESIDFSFLDSLRSEIDLQDTLLEEYFAEVEWSGTLTEFQNKIIPAGNLHFINSGPNKIYRDTFTATFWDIGIYIPKNPIVNYDPDSITIDEINVRNKALLVSPPLHIVNPDTTQLILPIEDIFEEAVTWKDYLVYIYLFLGIALIGILIYYILRKSGRRNGSTSTFQEKAVTIPPQVLALSKLETLANEQLWRIGKVKEHQSKLTYIIREYLENLFGIRALESTTDEILLALRDYDLDISHKDGLKEILQIADLVKFAKATPPEDLNEVFIAKAETFVVETHRKYNDLINTNVDEDE